MNSLELKELANKLRFIAVDMVYKGGDGHPGPALSCADVVTVLYFDEMKLDPKNPNWENRDRFILSKGHACPIWYAALSKKGYFGEEIEDFKLRQLNSMFQGHPTMQKTPGVDMTTGSLGNGISVGTGMALNAKLKGHDYRVFVIVGDGELQEGVCWEGANTAAAYKLENMFVFVDRNDWQSYKTVTETQGINNPGERFAAFGWDIQEVKDGHDVDALKNAIKKAKAIKGKPHCIVCNDVKGKGVSFMENNNNWHKGVPKKEQWEQAKKELLGGVN